MPQHKAKKVIFRAISHARVRKKRSSDSGCLFLTTARAGRRIR
jgi:hypothetical protein